ncbi:hypothetical protein GMRT_12804 [Giardia muris]|uniref:N-acetyltransferase domain-containing protein n=1 Tax=Giardia muris TaxID=5742 RepID=A0A4Z1SN34_GIAMU|nr:hypothetical protein GMRT_12804 [Giardia muris]|eukprot:TNJ27116.1 hypothetical protein GMRT_12804 [Giardia muris]
MFSTILPEAVYEDAVRRVINNLIAKNRPRILDHTRSLAYSLCQAPFHRTVVVGAHSVPVDESFRLSASLTHLEGICSYLPTYLHGKIKLCSELKDPTLNLPYPFRGDVVPLVSRQTGVEYSEYIAVTLLAGCTPDLEVSKVYALLYMPLLQALLKRIPLFIHELAMSPSFKQHLRGIGFTKINSHPTHTGYVLWPQDLLLNLFDDIESLILLSNPRCLSIAPTLDKFGCLHRILQIDRPQEITMGATLYSCAFMDDPLKICIQPKNEYLTRMIFALTRYILEYNAYRGLCYGLVNCDNNGRRIMSVARSGEAVQYANIIPFDSFTSCLIANPPGQTGEYWGAPSQILKIFTNEAKISAKNLFALSKIERNHSTHCGDPKNHLYVSWLAASINYRGFGLGAALMDRACFLADVCKAFVYLENSKFSNITFYNGFGFTVRHIVHVIHDAHEEDAYLMLREPNSRASRPIARIWIRDERQLQEEATIVPLK